VDFAMKTYAMEMQVPSIQEAEKAYNPDRPISSLLLHQLRQLHAAEQHLDEKDRTRINISTLHTEAQAGKYIQKVMKKLLARSVKNKKTAIAQKKKAKPVAAMRKTALKKKVAKKPATKRGK
jgi:hypothetical protein